MDSQHIQQPEFDQTHSPNRISADSGMLRSASPPPFDPQSGTGFDEEVGQLQRKSSDLEASSGEKTALPTDDGLPTQLRNGLERLSGLDLSTVKVHRNSTKPEQLNALAYAKGNEIFLGPGQEQHLPHEAWHLVQQKQGRVQANDEVEGESINNDPTLEEEADRMGEKAMQMGGEQEQLGQLKTSTQQGPAQLLALPPTDPPKKPEYNFDLKDGKADNPTLLNQGSHDNEIKGSVPGENPMGWHKAQQLNKVKQGESWVRFHLLNEQVGGKGEKGNLVPARTSDNHASDWIGYEGKIKDAFHEGMVDMNANSYKSRKSKKNPNKTKKEKEKWNWKPKTDDTITPWVFMSSKVEYYDDINEKGFPKLVESEGHQFKRNTNKWKKIASIKLPLLPPEIDEDKRYKVNLEDMSLATWRMALKHADLAHKVHQGYLEFKKKKNYNGHLQDFLNTKLVQGNTKTHMNHEEVNVESKLTELFEGQNESILLDETNSLDGISEVPKLCPTNNNSNDKPPGKEWGSEPETSEEEIDEETMYGVNNNNEDDSDYEMTNPNSQSHNNNNNDSDVEMPNQNFLSHDNNMLVDNTIDSNQTSYNYSDLIISNNSAPTNNQFQQLNDGTLLEGMNNNQPLPETNNDEYNSKNKSMDLDNEINNSLNFHNNYNNQDNFFPNNSSQGTNYNQRQKPKRQTLKHLGSPQKKRKLKLILKKKGELRNRNKQVNNYNGINNNTNSQTKRIPNSNRPHSSPWTKTTTTKKKTLKLGKLFKRYNLNGSDKHKIGKNLKPQPNPKN